jgi:hypothetical protein
VKQPQAASESGRYTYKDVNDSFAAETKINKYDHVEARIA